MADHRLIPDSIKDPSSLAFNELIERLGTLDITPVLIYMIDNVASSALPHLAEQFHVSSDEGWLLAGSESDRRTLIKRAIELHRHKGTPWAVKEVIRALGYLDVALQERLPVVVYDGQAAYSGSEDFGGGTQWALFDVLIDIGESKTLTQDNITRLVNAVNEWKNTRSHLRKISFSTSVTDIATVNEAQQLTAHPDFTDITPWGQRYDGSINHNNGHANLYGGSLRFNGAVSFAGSVATGVRYNNKRDDSALHIASAFTDQVKIAPLYNGRFFYGGFTYGAETPPVIDAALPITIRRHIRFNGTRKFGGENQYNGAFRFNGTKRFFEGIFYAGDTVTTEVTQ